MRTNQIERRRSERLLLNVAVVVCVKYVDNSSFREHTTTISVSAHGALLPLATTVRLGQTLVVINLRNWDERLGRVVRLGSADPEQVQIGIEFEQPAPEFWPVEPLPDGWASIRA